ncbi:MAG TPA: signal peptide peptidase SppA [Armatimonadota bacterium]
MDDQPINPVSGDATPEPVAEPAAPPPQAPPPQGATFGTAPGASATTFAAPPSAAQPPLYSAPRTSFSPPPPPPARDKKGLSWAAFFGGALFGCGCLPFVVMALFFGTVTSLISRGPSAGTGPSRDSVGLINVTGVITSGEADGGPFGGASGAEAQSIIDQLEEARKNDKIKSVVLWINSPGGSAAASDAVYTEVEKVRTGGKKVVVAMGDVAASGGYYIASAADRIYANGATLTGSIGVISELPNFSNPSGWIKKSGYDEIVVKSGKFKDMGNPMRPMTREEKALFQDMVDDIYNQFLTAVSKARRIDMATLRPLADGRVFTGRQAVKNGLVDKIGTLRDAIAYAGEQGGIKGDPPIYKLSSSPLSRLLSGTGEMYQGSMQRKMLGLLLLDPRAAALAKALEGGSGQVEAR